jgi:hypothetical protein
MNNTDLIARLKQTNQFSPNADVTTAEVVAALEAVQPAGEPVATLLRGGDYAFTKGSKPDEFDPVIHTEDDNPQKSWDACWQLQVESAAHELPAGKYELYTRPAPQVPMTTEDIETAFGKRYPHDLPLIKLAENNRDYALESIGARHHFAAFKAAITAAEAHHKIGVKP